MVQRNDNKEVQIPASWSEWRGSVTTAFEGLTDSIVKIDKQLETIYTMIHTLDKSMVEQRVKMTMIGVIAGIVASGIGTVVFQLILRNIK